MVPTKHNHGVNHLAIIMDGNRRWAKKHGLLPMEGHRRGYITFKKLADWCLDRGIEVLTIYAFSTENWKRSKKEVTFLMKLLALALSNEVDDLHRKNIRIKIIGRLKELPESLQRHIAAAVEKTKGNTRGTIQVAINYGGRSEIIDAVKKIVRSAKTASQITEKTVSESLYTAHVPDPDMIIRTSGEYRTSGFLPWQAVYSELYFTNKLWPDMREADLDAALAEYSRRQRRYGA